MEYLYMQKGGLVTLDVKTSWTDKCDVWKMLRGEVLMCQMYQTPAAGSFHQSGCPEFHLYSDWSWFALYFCFFCF